MRALLTAFHRATDWGRPARPTGSRMLRGSAATLIATAIAVASAGHATARQAPSLDPFPTCSALVDAARDAAQEPPVPFRGPINWTGSDTISPRSPFAKPDPNRPIWIDDVGPGRADSVSVAASAAPVSAGGAAELASSTTNVQEAGIDEPDLVKAVGGKLFVVAGTTLWALDATGDTPRVLGKLDLAGNGGTLLVEGTRALLLTPRQPVSIPIGISDQVASAPAPLPSARATTRITELDLADPAAMRILRTMDAPGDLVTARLTDGTARIVLNSAAALNGGAAGASTAPVPAEGVTARKARRLGVRSFVPRTVLRSAVTGKTYNRPLVRCLEVRHPEDPVGTDLLTVLSVDMRKGLFNIDRDAVLGSAQVVYASPTGLYVAASEEAGATSAGEVPRGAVTQIHRFDTSVRDQTTYASSGTVPGFPLNQYALSEQAGALRVATTKLPNWAVDSVQEPSESFVTVLREQGSALSQIGQVRGLGRSERIYAARFIGDVGYLVTFRQVDPLYTLDLADPEHPKVAGELKITGYSAYLHPVGDDLLLGIGREATDQGRATGAAISLFDVADPKAPKLLARKALAAGSQSSVEFDPHAFLWWAPAKLAVVPDLAPGDWKTQVGGIGSATGVHVDRAAGITDAGAVFHGPDWDHPMVKRTVVVGSRVLTLSDLGIQASAIGDLSAQGWLPWIAG